jgi:hypothetical protein
MLDGPGRSCPPSCRYAYKALRAGLVGYDTEAWERRFLELWPAGTDAYQSYVGRIRFGPDFRIAA